MTPLEQLEKWVQGESVHNTERDECCPDFSCCQPELLAPKVTREAFAKAYREGGADSQIVSEMLIGFLAGFTGKNVHVAGNQSDTLN
jgi:hypothetical protein